MSDHPRSPDLDRLVTACRGPVLTPVDDGYTEAATGWNLAVTQQPGVVVRAAHTDDVVHAVRYAAANGLGVAVQATGHGVAAPADEGTVLVVTADLDHVTIDPAARTATVGGGATLVPVLAEAQEHGLAPLVGSAPHVGAVGYHLGGGFGWLARRHGLAVDAVRALRVVLADGRVVTASATEEPDLFWALCGTGGGSLGVVVELTMALAPVAEVYAGNLFYPLDAAAEVFDRYREWSASAPDALTSAFTIANFPPLEAVPEPLRGNSFVIVRGCHAGDPADGEGTALVDQWRRWRTPLMDTWATMPFARSAEISMDPVDPVPAASSGRWLTAVDESVLRTMLDVVVGGDGPSPVLFAEVRHAGGAVAQPNPAVSFDGRHGDRLLEVVGMITDPATGTELERRFQHTWQELAPLLAPVPAFLNFVEGAEKVQLASAAFDDRTRDRLADVQRRYDPQHLFRHGIPLGRTG